MILILGDIHGNYGLIKWTIKHRHLSDTTIIQVGDFGVGYMPGRDVELLEDLNKFLVERNCHVYAIRGNHDDPKYFTGDYLMSNLKLMPDYSTARIEDKNFLFCGGAFSIDRKYSLYRMQTAAKYGLDEPCYWFDEHFVLDTDKLDQVGDIDVVITHTAPEWATPDNSYGFGSFVTAFFNEDQELSQDLLNERKLVSHFFEKLKQKEKYPSLHFYGHFHSSASIKKDGITHVLVDQGDFLDLDKYLPQRLFT